MKIFYLPFSFHDMQIDSFAFLLLARFGHCAPGKSAK